MRILFRKKEKERQLSEDKYIFALQMRLNLIQLRCKKAFDVHYIINEVTNL